MTDEDRIAYRLYVMYIDAQGGSPKPWDQIEATHQDIWRETACRYRVWIIEDIARRTPLPPQRSTQ